jgi:hypothetical protein
LFDSKLFSSVLLTEFQGPLLTVEGRIREQMPILTGKPLCPLILALFVFLFLFLTLPFSFSYTQLLMAGLRLVAF